MNTGKIPVRYAKAIFQLASEKGSLEKVKIDMEKILQLFLLPDFKSVIENPVLTHSKKKEIISLALGKPTDPSTLMLLDLVIKNHRENYLDGIAFRFIHLYREAKNIKSVVVTSVDPLDEQQIAILKEKITEKFKTEIEFANPTNKNMIGGFVLRMDNYQIDASIGAQLKAIKQGLTEKV